MIIRYRPTHTYRAGTIGSYAAAIKEANNDIAKIVETMSYVSGKMDLYFGLAAYPGHARGERERGPGFATPHRSDDLDSTKLVK